MSSELLVIEHDTRLGKSTKASVDPLPRRLEPTLPTRLAGELPVGEGGGAVESVSQTASAASARDWVQLTKPRIVVMVLVTAAVSAFVAAGTDLPLGLLFHTLFGTGLIGASAGVMNQIWEREIDGRMARTRRRPLPDGRIGTPAALGFCGLLGGVGACYLWQLTGLVPAAWGIATWLTYVVIYTPLKTRTSFNTTVGAVSGALPMMIGYTAAGGGSGDLVGWLLVGVLMVWQYPHFMAIAWMYRHEYGEAGFRMTPVVEPTGRNAAWQAVLGSVALMAVLVTLALLLVSGPLRWGFAAAMVLTTIGLLSASLRFARDRDTPSARRMMRASLLQLPAAMLVLVVASIF